MKKYCAFLRGVNIGGASMKMAEVCTVFEQAGMSEVQSVLATGNIIFQSDKSQKDLKPLLEKEVSAHFNYDAFLFIKNEDEVKYIVDYCPFEADPQQHTYVFITEKDYENVLMQEFETADVSDQEFAVIAGDNFYWQVPKGQTLDSKFGKILGKKIHKDRITSRNINTFEKIVKKL